MGRAKTWDGPTGYFWADEKALVVVAEQHPIAVYTAMRGDIAIRSTDADGDDVVILVRPENVPALARALCAEVGIGDLATAVATAEAAAPLGEPSVSKAATAAERKRRSRARKRDRRGDVTNVTRDHRDIDRDPERDMRDRDRDTMDLGDGGS